MATSSDTLSRCWEVFTLFVIPIGGGIPAGVLLAKSRGIQWPLMTLLYFVSDLLLAVVFEPLMLLAIRAAKRSTRIARVVEILKKSTRMSIAGYGSKLGPVSLTAISFGVDPMTGRAVAHAAGYRFVKGWTFAITGDMFYFLMLMVSTLFLSGILGDGTVATIAILVIMTIGPVLFRRFRAAWN